MRNRRTLSTVERPAVPERRGMAILLVLLLTLVMMFAITGVAMGTMGDRSLISSDVARTTAMTVAESGLQRYFASLSGVPRTGSDSTRADTTFTVSGGTVTIAARRLRTPGGASPSALYLVVARGTVSRYRLSPTAPNAEYAVAQFARYTSSTFAVTSAFTSLIATDKNGNSGAISGIDACGAKPAIPGLSLPNGTFTGQSSPIDGNPDNTPVYLGTAGPTGTAKDAVNIDWSGIVAGTFLPPDAAYNFASMPSSGAWNALFPSNLATIPITRITGNATFSGMNDGRGILIVTGNATISGSWAHKGLLLVGGSLTSNGNSTIQGAIMSGLNVKLGMTVAGNTQLNGNKTYQYDSCIMDSVSTRLNASLVPVRNGIVTSYPLF